MHPKSLHTLEFNKVLAKLAAHTTFSAGRELAEQLEPTSDPAAVARRLRETREALHLLAVRASISLGGAHDVRPQVAHARIGATILPPELLDVRDTLARGRAVRRGLLRLAHDVPRLAEIAGALMDESRAGDEIARCINDRAEVVDSASPELSKLRRELNGARSRLIERLQRMLGAGEIAKYLQEPIITQRGGRYVIPLKADFKGRVQGIVHDQSASGATVFVEPLATVEMNNRLRELELAEQKEVERVLSELTMHVAAEGERIIWTVEALAELDLIFAKAYYAEALNAKEPLIAQLPEGHARPAARLINLINARHPLLNPATVVPISLRLDEDVRILVITGPNTGGKTVTLKTVGLFALMAQAGLFLPASDGTTLPVFDDVFADIGDEQSIEQSLSTFSSHMRNVISFLGAAHRGALVLVDELGAGTDPVEGSALAQAILEDLRARGIMALVATHYTELKLYAHGTPGVQNASVEFDLETLRPTYRLTVGLPGRSNALSIALRLGLDARIVDAARERVSGEHLEAESLLLDLKNAREQAENDETAALKSRSEAERIERELRERLRRIEDERRQVLNDARRMAAQEIEQVRTELTETRKRLQDAAAESQLRAARTRLDTLAGQIEPDEEPSPLPGPARARAPVVPGDKVWIPTLKQRGEVVALNGADAEVQVGSLRLKLRAVQLEKAAPAESKPVVERSAVRTSAPMPDVASEIHLRGLTADEAVLKLDEYIDDAYMAGLPKVRVVHGKGTGTLRKAVRELLEGHPLVAGFRGGDRYEGEDGVTVVELVGR